MKKRIISMILCLSFIICVPLSTAAAAADQLNSCEYPLVVVRGVDFFGLYFNEGTASERPAIESFSAKNIAGSLIKTVGMSLINKKSAADAALAYAKSIFGNLACDNTGASVYDISCHKYPNAVGTYSDFPYSDGCEMGIIKRAVELYGGNNVYYVSYDWRMNPLDIADDVNAAVNKAISESGKSKVNLVSASMGGIITVAYMTKYGYSKLNKCIFTSSTFCGLEIVSNLLQGKVEINSDALYNFAVNYLGTTAISKTVLKIFKFAGVFNGLSSAGNNFINGNKQKIYDEVLTGTFGHMLSVWSLVSPENYDACISYMFGGKEEENAVLIQKTKELQQMVKGRDALLKKAAADGTEIDVITSYNVPLAPVYPGEEPNGDGALETKNMSGFASVADYGKTLDQSVINSGSPYVSADGVIDATNCLFPNTTWFIKNNTHVGFNYGTDCSDFLFWVIGSPSASVTSNPAYPQYMITDKTMSLAPLTK